jgi:hypothetical protein
LTHHPIFNQHQAYRIINQESRLATWSAGKAVTIAKFSEPGVYWLQLIADDGSAGGVLDENGSPGANLCCSPSDVVVVTVRPAGQ